MTSLKDVNGHPRDGRLVFAAGPHTYTVDDDETTPYMSVTTLIKAQFVGFNAPQVIAAMQQSPNWPQSKYFNQSAAAIQQGWDQTGAVAAAAGTRLHAEIEHFYNKGIWARNPMSCPELMFFLRFVQANPQLKPYRTEWAVFHEEWQVAGTIDMVYENPDGTLMIYDWKRVKNIVRTQNPTFAKYATTDGLTHIPDTNYWHYVLQLNTYKAILEHKYGKLVCKLALVCLHSSKTNFEEIVLPTLSHEITSLMLARK